MKSRFESRWANVLAVGVITAGAVTAFCLIRQDVYADTSTRLKGTYQREVATPRIISEYMRSHDVKKLQVGAGTSNLDGWLNSDIEPAPDQAYVDATKRTAFADGSLQYIFGEHVIEHLNYEDGLSFLKEAHRILAPGGKVRMVTPNLLQFVAMFDKNDAARQKVVKEYAANKMAVHGWPNTPDNLCFILNYEVRSWGHEFVYTPEMLRAHFAAAGFKNIRQYAPGESEDPVLKNVDARAKNEFKGINGFEAMAFEGTR